MNTNTKPTIAILYHANCVDGIVSAAITGLNLGLSLNTQYNTILSIMNAVKKDIQFIPVNYGQEIPEIAETVKGVFIVDFSYDITKLQAFLSERQEDVTIIQYDHHESSMIHLCECADKNKLIRTELSEPRRDMFVPNNWDNKKGFFTAIIDQEKSGALLCFDAANLLKCPYITTEKYEFIKYIASRVSDRDLWNFHYSDTRTVYECLISMIDYSNKETVFTLMKLLLGTTIDQFHRMPEYIKAETRVEMRLQFAKEYAAKAVKVHIDGKVGALVNTPANFSSEVGDVLGKSHDFAIMYVIGRSVLANEATVWFSLRSNKVTGINVEQLVKKLSDNGGGHVNAAGFRGSLTTLKTLYRHSYVNEEDKPESLRVSGYDFPVPVETLHRVSDEDFMSAFINTQLHTELNMPVKSILQELSLDYDWVKLLPIIKSLEGIEVLNNLIVHPSRDVSGKRVIGYRFPDKTLAVGVYHPWNNVFDLNQELMKDFYLQLNAEQYSRHQSAILMLVPVIILSDFIPKLKYTPKLAAE